MNSVDLPKETRPCPQCGKRMVAAYTGMVYSTSPPGREWIWWCKCGRRDNGSVVSMPVDRIDIERRWEKANKP